MVYNKEKTIKLQHVAAYCKCVGIDDPTCCGRGRPASPGAGAQVPVEVVRPVPVVAGAQVPVEVVRLVPLSRGNQDLSLCCG